MKYSLLYLLLVSSSLIGMGKKAPYSLSYDFKTYELESASIQYLGGAAGAATRPRVYFQVRATTHPFYLPVQPQVKTPSYIDKKIMELAAKYEKVFYHGVMGVEKLRFTLGTLTRNYGTSKDGMSLTQRQIRKQEIELIKSYLAKHGVVDLEFIQKPYSIGEVVQRYRELLKKDAVDQRIKDAALSHLQQRNDYEAFLEKERQPFSGESLKGARDLVTEKSKLFGLDSATDFKSVGNSIIDSCDFVLTGLNDQSPEHLLQVKQEFVLEIASAQQAESLEQFSYHLSAADLRLEIAKHMQEYHQRSEHIPEGEFAQVLFARLERSSELLGRAIVSFAQRAQDTITHPHHELYNRVMAPMRLATLGYSVGKIATQYGTAFISSEDKWQFACKTWNALAVMCDQITAESFWDGVGVLAAEVVTQRGLSKLCRYLSKLELATEAVGKGNKLYNHIEKGVDRALQKKPIVLPDPAKVPAADIVADLKQKGLVVPGLSKKSINTVRALKEHPLYYVMRRTYRDIKKLEPMYEKKYKGFDTFADKYITFPLKHIFAPEFKKKGNDFIGFLSGWHHDHENIIEKSGLIEFVSKKIGANGVYDAGVKWRGRVLNKSFFPSHLNPKEVLNLITEAYEDFIRSGSNFVLEDSNYKVVGYTKNRIKILIYITSSGKIKTCYPVSEGS